MSVLKIFDHGYICVCVSMDALLGGKVVDHCVKEFLLVYLYLAKVTIKAF